MTNRNSPVDAENLSDDEIEALHRLQLGREEFRKAHGHLLEFHHKIGRGMNEYAEAVELLRETGHDDLADTIQESMAVGVIDGRWSWSIVDEFEDLFMPTTTNAEQTVRDTLTENGDRHINEQLMENDARDSVPE